MGARLKSIFVMVFCRLFRGTFNTDNLCVFLSVFVAFACFFGGKLYHFVVSVFAPCYVVLLPGDCFYSYFDTLFVYHFVKHVFAYLLMPFLCALSILCTRVIGHG